MLEPARLPRRPFRSRQRLLARKVACGLWQVLTDHIAPMVQVILPAKRADSHGVQVEFPESVKTGEAKEKLYTVDRRLKGNSKGSKIPSYTWQATQHALSYAMQNQP